MDPALASIVGTSILGGCSVVVALITTRRADRRVIEDAVDDATETLRDENTLLKAQLATHHHPDGGTPDEA